MVVQIGDPPSVEALIRDAERLGVVWSVNHPCREVLAMRTQAAPMALRRAWHERRGELYRALHGEGPPVEPLPSAPEANTTAWRWRRGRREQATPGTPAAPEPVGEPDEGELAGVANGRDLLALCRRYGIGIGWDDAAGVLRTSRPLEVSGPLARAIKRYRSSVIKHLSAGR